MPVGGAETLLVNLIRRLDRSLVVPHLICLKELGPLGEELAREIPHAANLIRGKADIGVLLRIRRFLREHAIRSVVTVGAGDKMFWGRLAAKLSGCQAIFSALHSTGWPDGVGRLNRLLTPITDGFIAVADSHGKFLREFEGFPDHKVFVIPNGVDTARFIPRDASAPANDLRCEIGAASTTRLVGIVAALREEKNHSLFVRSAARVLQSCEDVEFVIVGDGPERASIQNLAAQLGIQDRIHLLGTRSDTCSILSQLDLFALTSHNEANPVSILEALSCKVPVVATDVGSIKESVLDGKTGLLIPPGDDRAMAAAWIRLLNEPTLREQMGFEGRKLVEDRFSLDAMVHGYTHLIQSMVNAPISPQTAIAPPLLTSSAMTPTGTAEKYAPGTPSHLTNL